MAAKRKSAVGESMKQLGELVNNAGLLLQPTERAEEEQNAEKSAPEPLMPKESGETTDEEIFGEAMAGVERVFWRNEPHAASPVPPAPGMDRELEDRRLMQKAMDASFPIAIPDHPEYIEGWVGVEGKRFLPNLRNGLYSIQGQLDLHGLSREEAGSAVEDYIVRMSRFRPCCVKIIHGRGINSPADRATLKDSLQRLLSTRRMSRYVVAYASAAARDGGVGAVYVLLKKP